eukprot:364765-Chlamydomonas_euryale.AAC.2
MRALNHGCSRPRVLWTTGALHDGCDLVNTDVNIRVGKCHLPSTARLMCKHATAQVEKCSTLELVARLSLTSSGAAPHSPSSAIVQGPSPQPHTPTHTSTHASTHAVTLNEHHATRPPAE